MHARSTFATVTKFLMHYDYTFDPTHNNSTKIYTGSRVVESRGSPSMD